MTDRLAGIHHHQHGGTDVYDDCCQSVEHDMVTVRKDDLEELIDGCWNVMGVRIKATSWYRLRVAVKGV